MEKNIRRSFHDMTKSDFYKMSEGKLAEFAALVQSSKYSVLSSIEEALHQLFPYSSSNDPIFSVRNPVVFPNSFFGEDNPTQIRIGTYQADNYSFLIIERDDDSITLKFGENGATRQSLPAYDLIGQYLLNMYLNGSGYELRFEQNLRQVIKINYRRNPAVVAIYSDINPDRDSERAVLHTEKKNFQSPMINAKDGIPSMALSMTQ